MADHSKEKLHRQLDGEPVLQDLTPGAARELATHQQIIREARALYRSVESPDLSAKIMSRIETRSQPADKRQRFAQRVWTWFMQPRPMPMRPAFAILAATAFLLLGDPLFNTETASTPETVASKIFVQFRLDAPKDSNVHLAGSFTGWKPEYSLRETAPGIFSVLVPLEPGVHDYGFLVDGKWITDPVAPAVDDGFGGANSRLLVVVPETSSRL
jgi:hypothetical protein